MTTTTTAAAGTKTSATRTNGTTTSFRCLVLGEEPLATACADVLLERGHKLTGLVTNNPAMKQWARERGVELVERAHYGDVMARGDVDVLFSITHPAIIKPEHFKLARVDAVNFHDGPLPRYAGIHGSAWALLRGEKKHAIVWHRIEEGIDTGRILERRDVDIDDRETALSLNIKNASLALDAFKSVIEKLEKSGPQKGDAQPSDVERLVFSRFDRPEALGTLDFEKPAADLDRVVRACDWGAYVNRFAVAKIVHRGAAGEHVLVVKEATAIERTGAPGTILEADSKRIVVACGEGSLRIERVGTVRGVDIALDEALKLLEVNVGDKLVDANRGARHELNRALAEGEPFFVRRLEKLEPPALPFAPGVESAQTARGPADVHALPLPELRAKFADDIEAAAVAAFSFVVGSLCDKDDVHCALVDHTARKRLDAASSLLAPAMPLFARIDAAKGFDALVAHVRAELTELRKRGAYLLDLVPRTPSLAHQRALPSGVLSPVAVLLDDDRPVDRLSDSGATLPPGAVIGLRIAGGQASLVVDTRAVDNAQAKRILDHIRAVCSTVARDPSRALATVDLLDDEQRKRQVFDWNSTQKAFADDLLIHARFEQRVDTQPDATALHYDGATVTFAELEKRANRIANALIARGVGPGDYVAFRLERDFDLVATMIGVAKSGAAYVPIDPTYPVDRARFMVSDAHAKCVITTPKLDRAFDDAANVVNVDDPEIASAPSTRPAHRASPKDVCYAIFTSGSTGTPKGVVLTHRAVVNTLEWVNATMKVTPADRLLFVTSPSFDLSVYDVFGALGAGASIEIASTETLREPTLLVEKLVQPGITIWDSAPPALARLSSFFPPYAPSSTLRLAMMSGDWIPVKLPDELRAVFPKVQPVSLGGATEAAIWSNFHVIGDVDPLWRSIPYGRPIQNARYYILDKHMRPVPVGVAGDLYIGGTCLAQGYLNRAQLTAERFVADPFVEGERIYKTGDLARFWNDGTMEFLGRADFQVKVRGFRVELGEIEAFLRKQSGVKDAVCITRTDASGEKAIVAYVVPSANGASIDAGALKNAIGGALPEFMVPSAIVRLDRLPVTQNGKLDRKALPDPASVAEKREIVPPRTPLETKLVALFSELLRQPVGIRDDFFDDMGGHSLLAVVLVTRLKKDLGIDVPLSRILAKPTVAALAESLDDNVAAPSEAERDSVMVPLNTEGTKPTFLVVTGAGGHVFIFRELARQLGPDQPVYAFAAIGADGEEVPRQSVEEIAVEYEREIELKGLPGPFVIGGYSFGALVAEELAWRLRRRGKEVLGLVAFDAFAPGYPEKMPRGERVLAHVEELAKRDFAGRAEYMMERFDNAKRRVLTLLGLGHLTAPGVAGADKDREEKMKRVWIMLLQAQSSYRPKAQDPGPLLLFTAEHPFKWPATRMDDPTKGWRKWVRGRIDVIVVKGSHLELFRNDNIERMATAITGLVDELVKKRAPKPKRHATGDARAVHVGAPADAE